jgi:hypothetical protein
MYNKVYIPLLAIDYIINSVRSQKKKIKMGFWEDFNCRWSSFVKL